jgi:uncharacterized OB-fold protein
LTSPAAPERSARYLPEDWTLPLLTDENTPFFTSGELVLQHCESCRAVQHPPIDLCRHCQGTDFSYRAATGRGRISSFTIVHNAADPRLEATVPYNVVVVELDDQPGVMIVGNVVNCPAEDLSVGLPLRCTFAEVSDPSATQLFLLPQWELL